MERFEKQIGFDRLSSSGRSKINPVKDERVCGMLTHREIEATNGY